MYEYSLTAQERDILLQALNSTDVRGIQAMVAVVNLFTKLQNQQEA